MTFQVKIYIAIGIAVIFTIGILGGTTWSGRTITTLEQTVETARTAAEVIEQKAAEKEIEAAAYREKIDYLENQLKEIQTIARKQDEELEKLSDSNVRARGDVERARRTRSVAATAEELCAKLAELGHGCE